MYVEAAGVAETVSSSVSKSKMERSTEDVYFCSLLAHACANIPDHTHEHTCITHMYTITQKVLSSTI